MTVAPGRRGARSIICAALLLLCLGCGEATFVVHLGDGPRDNTSQGGLVIVIDNVTVHAKDVNADPSGQEGYKPGK